MKRLLLMSLSLAGISLIAKGGSDYSDIYFSCGFDDGIPTTFRCTDNDGCQLHFTMVQLGFGETDSWVAMQEEGKDNIFAASASRHKKIKGEDPRPSDDWLVTPQIWIKGDDARLSWKGMSLNESLKTLSSYKVMVSTGGQLPSDFTEAPLAVIADEPEREWTSHSLDLSVYKGEKIYVAFVNTTLGGEVLAIDDITVEGEKGLADLVVTPGEYWLDGEEVEIGGSVTACSEVPVETLTLICEAGGETMRLDYRDLGLEYGETFSFAFPQKIRSAYGEKVSFSVSAEINGIDYGVTERTTTLLAFKPERKVLVEEVTGMWCGYCPEGIVAMETLQEKYPGSFIGVAVHTDDRLEVDGYPPVETMFPGGAPTGWFDRKIYNTTPLVSTLVDGKYTYVPTMGGFETSFLERMEELSIAEIKPEASVEDGSLHISASVRFPLNISGADCRVSFLLVEDGLWGKGFYQMNYHSGGKEIIGGFESLPERIEEGMVFNHVLRGVYGGFDGISGVIPTDIRAGEEYLYEGDWDLPAFDIDISKARLVGLVIDSLTGEILNAAAAPLESAGLGEANVPAGPSVILSGSCLTARGSGEVAIVVNDLSGRTIVEASGHEEVSVDVSTLSGIYLVRSVAAGLSTVVKATF